MQKTVLAVLICCVLIGGSEQIITNNILLRLDELSYSLSPLRSFNSNSNRNDLSSLNHSAVIKTSESPPIPLWNFSTGYVEYYSGEWGPKWLNRSGVRFSTPIVKDVDNDGKLEVIFGSLANKVFALPAENGTEYWNFPTSDKVDSSPALGNLDDDLNLEVVFGSADDNVYALHAENGTELWRFLTEGDVDSSPILVDINSDSKLEVIICSDDGNLYVINGKNGTKLWNKTTNIIDHSSPALGDLNDDGKLDVIITGYGDRMIYALNGEDGTQLWNKSMGLFGPKPLSKLDGIPDGISTSPTLGDVDNDRKLEVIVIAEDNRVLVFNAEDGSSVWTFTHPTGTDLWACIPALGDVDNNKKLDIIVGGEDTLIALEGSTGAILWESYGFGEIITTPSLVDIDNDPMLEVVYGTIFGFIHAVNIESGSGIWPDISAETIVFSGYNLGFTSLAEGFTHIMASISFMDIDNDAMLEMIVGSASLGNDDLNLEGKLFAFDLPEAGNRIYWEGGRGTNPTSNLLDIDPDMDFLSNYSEYTYSTDPFIPDTDNDGMIDGWEVSFGINPLINDASTNDDNDTLTNIEEYYINTNPTDNDTDYDGMPDDWEYYNNLNPRVDDADKDLDSDGLQNIEEYRNRTDPLNGDSDGDGLIDGDEVNIYQTNPNNQDTDYDNMADKWEIEFGLNPSDDFDRDLDPDKDGLTNYNEYGIKTNPQDNDTDDDWLSDGDEVYIHITKPLNNDTDTDSMWDGWEVKFQLNPLDPNDAHLDVDGDGLTNLEEFEFLLRSSWLLNPTLYDTDNDGLSDGEEVKGTTGFWTNPVNNDTDNDSLLDGLEVSSGLNATNPDTDNDGDSDGDEYGEFLLDPANPWLNKWTRNLIIIGGSSSLSLLILGGVFYRFLYIPRRIMIKEWWNRRVLRLYHRDEDFLKYAGKARKMAKKFDDK